MWVYQQTAADQEFTGHPCPEVSMAPALEPNPCGRNCRMKDHSLKRVRLYKNLHPGKYPGRKIAGCSSVHFCLAARLPE